MKTLAMIKAMINRVFMGSKVQGSRFKVGRFQVSGFRFQVSGFRFQVSGFRFQVSGFRDCQSIYYCSCIAS